MTAAMAMAASGILVSEVSDVDRRTARRLGMDAERVNLIINTWASEFLKYESERNRLRQAARPDGTPPPPTEAPRVKARSRKATSAPRKAAAKSASTPTQPTPTESPSDADVAATEGSPS